MPLSKTRFFNPPFFQPKCMAIPLIMSKRKDTKMFGQSVSEDPEVIVGAGIVLVSVVR